MIFGARQRLLIMRQNSDKFSLEIEENLLNVLKLSNILVLFLTALCRLTDIHSAEKESF